MTEPREDESCPDLSGLSGHFASPARVPNAPTPRQSRAIEAMLQEPTIARAAATAGVSERTLRRWMKEGPFKKAFFDARRESFGQAIGLTQRYAPVAIATLVKVMNDDATSASSKVTAAAVLLRFGREGMELDDLAERLEALETAMASRQEESQR